MTPFADLSSTAPDFTDLLLSCELFTEGTLPCGATPPRIHSRSPHFRFALHVLAGYPYDDACHLLNLSPRTAERWRTDLRRVASRYFGRPITYEFAARYALDRDLRRCYEGKIQSVRGSPQ